MSFLKLGLIANGWAILTVYKKVSIIRTIMKNEGEKMFLVKADYGFQGNETICYKDVHIEFDYGDIINVIGENGCGKSTFYKVLMGKLKPLKGKVSAEIIENTAVVSDYIGLPTECLVGDILKLIGNEKVEYVKEGFPEMYNNVHHLKDKKVSILSTGQKRIVEIFCALSTKKKILILDEANNGLDIYNRQMLINQLKKLAGSGKVVIFNTTHYMEDVVELGGKIYIMNKHNHTMSQYHGELSVEKIVNHMKEAIRYAGTV